MGLKCTPDFAQHVMEEVILNIDNIGIYLDKNVAFSMIWEYHILQLNKILYWLVENGFPVNLLK